MPRVSHDEVILAKALHDLEREWSIACLYWKDEARRRFEKEFLDELIPDVRRAADAISRTNQILHRAVKECS